MSKQFIFAILGGITAVSMQLQAAGNGGTLLNLEPKNVAGLEWKTSCGKMKNNEFWYIANAYYKMNLKDVPNFPSITLHIGQTQAINSCDDGTNEALNASSALRLNISGFMSGTIEPVYHNCDRRPHNEGSSNCRVACYRKNLAVLVDAKGNVDLKGAVFQPVQVDCPAEFKVGN